MTTVSSLFNRVLSRLSPQRHHNSRPGSSSRSPSPRHCPSPTDVNSNTRMMSDSNPNGTAGSGTATSTTTTSNNNSSSGSNAATGTATGTGTQTSGRVTRSRTRARIRDRQAATQNGTDVGPSDHADTGPSTRRSGADSVNGNAHPRPTKAVDQATETTEGTSSFKGEQLPKTTLGLDEDEENDNSPECAVCLLPCIHPVQLPCTHIFCFLCVKGVANQSKRCALCRQEIPVDFLNNPALLRLDRLLKEWQLQEGNQWYYEGKNGWWQYDVRTSQEMEEKYAKEEHVFELLIAGFLYVIDLKNMVQIRRNDPTRRRRIKRDVASIPDKKGVAGLKVQNSASGQGTPERRQGDGGELAAASANASASRGTSAIQGATAAATATATQTVVPSAPPLDAQSVDSIQAAKDAKPDSLLAPTNSPQRPESGGTQNNDSQTTDEEDEEDDDLPSQMSSLRLARERRQMQIPRMRRRRRHRHRRLLGTHYLDTPSTSSDSDYDY